MIRIYYVCSCHAAGFNGYSRKYNAASPFSQSKKRRKKKFEFILQALLKDNKNVRKGPSETKQRNLLHVFYSLVLQLKSQQSLALKKEKSTLTGYLERRYWARLMQVNKRESTAFVHPEKALLPAESVPNSLRNTDV